MKYTGYEAALRHAVLTKEQERVLLTRYAELRAELGAEHPSTLKVRNQVITANLRAVAKMARRYKRLPFEDLMGEGVKGLVIAVERFDVERGLRFNTFAQYWIRHALQRACINTGSAVRVPVHQQAALYSGRRDADGVKLGSVAISLDAPVGEDGSGSLHDLIASESAAVLSDLTDMQDAAAVRRAVCKLPSREREIIERRYLRDKEETLQEVGEVVGDVSRERVRQIESDAFAKLRRALAKHRPESREAGP